MKKTKSSKKSGNRLVLQIVKRQGHSEVYDEMKAYGSCFFACKNAHLSDNEAEAISENVVTKLSKWIKERKVVSSNEIFRFMMNELKKHNEDVSFLYETHRDIS